MDDVDDGEQRQAAADQHHRPARHGTRERATPVRERHVRSEEPERLRRQARALAEHAGRATEEHRRDEHGDRPAHDHGRGQADERAQPRRGAAGRRRRVRPSARREEHWHGRGGREERQVRVQQEDVGAPHRAVNVAVDHRHREMAGHHERERQDAGDVDGIAPFDDDGRAQWFDPYAAVSARTTSTRFPNATFMS